MFSPDSLLDLDRTEHSVIFENTTHAWEALSKISTYLQFRLKPCLLYTSDAADE